MFRERPQARLLPDGKRLHLNHGPIDLIIESSGDKEDAYRRATKRFETVLEELVGELPQLRSSLEQPYVFQGKVAQRMYRAVEPMAERFITPMAAVAGSVADEILAEITEDRDITKAYVNNGGDVAFHLSGSACFDVEIATQPPGKAHIRATDPVRGVATSGWRGRSFSLGIADSVTVLARNAAEADAAATMIANEIDLPSHPGITRAPASELAPDSDLGDQLVTTNVGALTVAETEQALQSGEQYARTLRDRGCIAGAVMMLNGEVRWVGTEAYLQGPEKERLYA